MRAFLFSLPLAVLTLAAPFALPAPAEAGQFSPAITVNGSIVTEYEIDQRTRFLTLLRAPGDVRKLAEDGLIDDRLRSQAAREAGIVITNEQLAQGMAEFAGRANLETEQFIQAIGEAGVAPETFRDFVKAGLEWRDYVRGTYMDTIVIGEAAVDKALTVAARRGAGPRVLLSEILIPFSPGDTERVRELSEGLAGSIRSEADFAAAARRYSAAVSRDQGGQIGWIPLTNLPAQARGIVAQMAVGEVSPPIRYDNVVALFRKRGQQEGGAITTADTTLDYAQILIPGAGTAEAASEAARLAAQSDSCDDLYRAAARYPASRLIRDSRPAPQVPSDIARLLAGLDDNESTSALTRGGNQVFLMLCSRSATRAIGGQAPLAAPAPPVEGAPAIDPELGFGLGPDRAQVRDEVGNVYLLGMAGNRLAELRAQAIITRP